MKFDIQLKLVKSGVNLFVSDGNRFDWRSANVDCLLLIYVLVQLIFI
jgi:hypothetical protein